MKERLIKDMIFCGTPEVYFQGLGKLHAQVNRALSYISGLQQPPHSTSEEQARMDEYEREIGWGEVRTCVEDIVCALLGPDYHIKENISEMDFDALKSDFIELLKISGPNPGWHSILYEVENLVNERVRQEDHATANLNSIYRHHTCSHYGCEERAEYMVGDGFGRTLLVCETHYTTLICDRHFSHCPPGRK